jgi:cytoskeletal protein CcmA (bactofilin family)
MANAANVADSIGKTGKFALNEAPRAGTTVLGTESHITGNVAATGDIVVAGVIEGEITSQGRVTVSNGGTVKGRISATEIVIEGAVVGDSAATKSLSIMSSAQVRGDISTPVIVIEPGASFVGRCTMPENAARAA